MSDSITEKHITRCFLLIIVQVKGQVDKSSSENPAKYFHPSFKNNLYIYSHVCLTHYF